MEVGDLVINMCKGITYGRIGIILEMPKPQDLIHQVLVSTVHGVEWWFIAITRRLDASR